MDYSGDHESFLSNSIAQETIDHYWESLLLMIAVDCRCPNDWKLITIVLVVGFTHGVGEWSSDWPRPIHLRCIDGATAPIWSQDFKASTKTKAFLTTKLCFNFWSCISLLFNFHCCWFLADTTFVPQLLGVEIWTWGSERDLSWKGVLCSERQMDITTPWERSNHFSLGGRKHQDWPRPSCFGHVLFWRRSPVGQSFPGTRPYHVLRSLFLFLVTANALDVPEMVSTEAEDFLLWTGIMVKPPWLARSIADPYHPRLACELPSNIVFVFYKQLDVSPLASYQSFNQPWWSLIDGC